MTLLYEDKCWTCHTFLEDHPYCHGCKKFVCQTRSCQCQDKGDAA